MYRNTLSPLEIGIKACVAFGISVIWHIQAPNDIIVFIKQQVTHLDKYFLENHTS